MTAKKNDETQVLTILYETCCVCTMKKKRFPVGSEVKRGHCGAYSDSET